ncbi:MAG: HAD family hydrolase [Bacteroidetes bacterium]|nr:HAD family hydrolase [Bacteroidota bacterium]
MNFQKELKDLQPIKKFFIGIDSDGCVFDSMEPKQKEFFCPNVIRFFGLFPIARIARETWEFTNLYSQTRGVNRFLALLHAFDLLRERTEVQDRGFRVPDLSPLKEWTRQESKLGNPALEAYAEKVRDPVIDLVLDWSQTINKEIGQWLKDLPPFPPVPEILREISEYADSIVVSQTPGEALEREWEEYDIAKYVRAIAGQEQGTKSEHLALAAADKYPKDKILMIGDAPGDLKAARQNDVLFYPVIPGKEEESWKRLQNEGLDRFLKGKYAGDYENRLLDDFNKGLPEYPLWKTI